MSNAEHVAKFREGVSAWNTWRLENSTIHPDLSNEDLARTNLGDWEHYRFADLTVAKLRRVNLQNTNLTNVSFMRADLKEVNFAGANLHGATLLGAHLQLAQFINADMAETNLSDAKLGRTVFANVDLGKTRGLTTVNHEGPSTVGVDTLIPYGLNI